MKAPSIPRKNSKIERSLIWIVGLSPVAVCAHFLYRLATNAYPPEADSIAIPVFGYFIFPFPAFLTMSILGREGLNETPIHLFWNPGRNLISAIWTTLFIYPIGLFLLFLFLDSVAAKSILSLLYTLLLVVAAVIYRAGAISRA